jgi:tRNA(adenine34) deaminase
MAAGYGFGRARMQDLPPCATMALNIKKHYSPGHRGGYAASMSLPLPKAMRLALDLAAEAARAGEVPVAAVIMQGERVIAQAANAMRAGTDPTAHAEIVAIRAAAAVLGSERLSGCDMWVTLEPCAMCAGAIAHARLARLYYAASDPKGGAVEHGARVFAQSTCHHLPEIYSGIGEGESADTLRSFFSERR